MRDLGYIEGESFVLETRDSVDRLQQPADGAAYMAALPVDLFLAQGSPGVLAAQQATRTIPIVMVISTDPIGEGHVDTLARPGGMVTGLSAMTRELGGKRLELLKLAVPTLSHPAILWSPADPAMPASFAEVRTAAQILGLTLQSLEVDDARDLAPAFAVAVRDGVDGLLVLPTGFIIRNRQAIVDLAAAYRLPAMYPYRDFVIDGGLMNYGPSFVAMFRRAAYYVDRILKGTKPADLPIEQPMTFDFVVNMKTARELSITFPREILLQVTEVIQ
jgi:putative ABC transport system substrate-binding protein